MKSLISIANSWIFLIESLTKEIKKYIKLKPQAGFIRQKKTPQRQYWVLLCTASFSVLQTPCSAVTIQIKHRVMLWEHSHRFKNLKWKLIEIWSITPDLNPKTELRFPHLKAENYFSMSYVIFLFRQNQSSFLPLISFTSHCLCKHMLSS